MFWWSIIIENQLLGHPDGNNWLWKVIVDHRKIFLPFSIFGQVSAPDPYQGLVLSKKQKMDANNNQLKGDREIFAYPGGKARSSVWKTFGFYKKKDGPPSKE